MANKRTTKVDHVLDDVLDFGEAIVQGLDRAKIERRKLVLKRVNVDFPIWMVEQLDAEAERRGITRQSLIKMWLSDRLDVGGRKSG